MQKSKQFYAAAIMAFVGVVLLSVDRLTASADALTSYGQNFSIITIIGLIIMMVAAVWFYYLSFK